MQKVAIHSVPRSGSTWLGSIFDSHPKVIYKFQPLFSHAFKGRLDERSSQEDIVQFFKDISLSDDEFINQMEKKNERKIPEFDKANQNTIVYKEVRYHHILNNLLLKDNGLKVIGLIRNPISALYSWYNAPREFRKDLGWRIEDEWETAPSKNRNKKEEYNGYEKWKEIACLFTELNEKYPSQFYLVTYSNLISNTAKTVEELFDFAGLKFHSQTKAFIDKSTSISDSDSYSVFKQKRHDHTWLGKFDESIVRSIEQDLIGTSLEIYLSA